VTSLNRQIIQLRTEEEIEKLRKANGIVTEVLALVEENVKPGVTTAHLDKIAEERCRKRGAKPAFLGYKGFPASLCVSINDEIVHGIPSKDRRLAEGDIVSLDFGTIWDGYVGDAAITVPVGKVSDLAMRLMRVTKESLDMGIRATLPGGRLYDIGHAVQTIVEAAGFSVVRDFVGHGIGTKMHEPPQVPNSGRKGTGPRLAPGMVLAIEPMVNAGGWEIKIKEDGWTAVTADGSLSAHFEHSVAISESGPIVLSAL